MPPAFAAEEKSRRSRCGNAIEAPSRPSGQISSFEAARDARHEHLTGTTMAPTHVTTQGYASIDLVRAGTRVARAANARLRRARATAWEKRQLEAVTSCAAANGGCYAT